jgi:thiosulfate/3-mercaptopyruvate sulfurtransferase
MTVLNTLVDVETLAALVADDACRVVDCRSDLFDADKGSRDYLGGHIPGAVFADLDRDLAREITPDTGRHPLPDPASFCRWLEGCGIGDTTQVIVYDYGNGALAARLWWMLHEWLGHTAVAVLDGGISAWQAAGHRLEGEVPAYPRATITCSPDEAAVATTAEISAAIGEKSPMVLLDARDKARFLGEHEPIDAVAGRVPGALNLPFVSSLGDDGQWLGVPALQALWEGVPRSDHERPVAMCGSGVTACHLVLSARVAGVPPPRLYVGSWSEWIRDPRRPVATGEAAADR